MLRWCVPPLPIAGGGVLVCRPGPEDSPGVQCDATLRGLSPNLAPMIPVLPLGRPVGLVAAVLQSLWRHNGMTEHRLCRVFEPGQYVI